MFLSIFLHFLSCGCLHFLTFGTVCYSAHRMESATEAVPVGEKNERVWFTPDPFRNSNLKLNL